MAEVMVDVTSSPDFRFETAPAATYMSAPSSPKPFGSPFDLYYQHTSAPGSPSRAADVYAQLAGMTLDWEEGPQTPRLGRPPGEKITDLIAADVLFDGGRARPLGSPPRTPRMRGGEQASRGRERTSRRGPRSLSSSPSPSTATSSAAAATFTKGDSGGGGSRKWRLRDLLLFRNASEGRVSGRGSKDHLRKYTALSQSSSSSLLSSPSHRRSEDSEGSVRRRGAAAASAHEMHYTANRAASEEMKKKTPLPFRRNGLFGFLHYNPAIRSVFNGHPFTSRRQS